MPSRRQFVGGSGSAMLLAAGLGGEMMAAETNEGAYGRIGMIRAAAGKGDELARYLLEGTEEMPGNIAYLVAQAADDSDALWVTEVWDSAESHRASLDLPQVQQAIARARPIIADFEVSVETRPLKG